MKFESRMRHALASMLITLLALSTAAYSTDKKEKTPPPKYIDSGTFGIFMKGQRVASETFTIQQQEAANVIKSQFKQTDGDATQKSDLEITAGGELIRYEWSQSSGGSLSVFPDNEFLKERITSAGATKAAEQAFLLPGVTPILDNNFFVHRQILAWKFLSQVCAPVGGENKCRQEPADFGVLVPQDRTSMSVRMEIVRNETISIRGTDRQLLHLSLHGDQFDWDLWVDESDHFKLVRILIPADNTEVLRD